MGDIWGWRDLRGGGGVGASETYYFPLSMIHIGRQPGGGVGVI